MRRVPQLDLQRHRRVTSGEPVAAAVATLVIPVREICNPNYRRLAVYGARAAAASARAFQTQRLGGYAIPGQHLPLLTRSRSPTPYGLLPLQTLASLWRPRDHRGFVIRSASFTLYSPLASTHASARVWAFSPPSLRRFATRSLLPLRWRWDRLLLARVCVWLCDRVWLCEDFID